MIGFELLSQGTLDMLLIHPRDVFRMATARNAAAVIIAHNHPSGDPTPSDADIKVTKNLIRAGEMMQIELVDSVVIGAEAHKPSCFSIRSLDYWDEDVAESVTAVAAETDAAPPPRSTVSNQEITVTLTSAGKHLGDYTMPGPASDALRLASQKEHYGNVALFVEESVVMNIDQYKTRTERQPKADRSLWAALQNSENLLAEINFFVGSVRAAMRTWRAEGSSSDEKFNQEELGFFNLWNRLNAAAQEQIEIARQAAGKAANRLNPEAEKLAA
jgi:hypothetical protein